MQVITANMYNLTYAHLLSLFVSLLSLVGFWDIRTHVDQGVDNNK